MAGTIAISVGAVCVLLGGSLTRCAVTKAYGRVDEYTMAAAQGTGVNPRRARFLVIGGWICILAGIVLIASK